MRVTYRSLIASLAWRVGAFGLVLLLLGAEPALWPQAPSPGIRTSPIALTGPLRITRSARIAPGTYTIAAPAGGAVIEIAADGVVLDLTGVTLQAPATEPWRRHGIGILAQGHNNITLRGGSVRGYCINARLADGHGFTVEGGNFSGSRAQRLLSTPTHYDEADWVDIFHLAAWQAYGAGLWLQDATQVAIRDTVADAAQNGIALINVRYAVLSGNEASHNSGWGIALFRSSDNQLWNNHADWNVRCEAARYSHGCDSAGMLLMDGSSRNTLVENTFTHSGDGYFSSKPESGASSDENVVAYNDGSDSPHNAFESTFSTHDQFIGNVADRSGYGFWLGFSRMTSVTGNQIVGSHHDGIAIEHGSDNLLLRNRIADSTGAGIRLFRRPGASDPSRNYVVLGNILQGNHTGLVVRQSQQVRVIGNQMVNNGNALDVDRDSSDVLLHGNQVKPGR